MSSGLDFIAYDSFSSLPIVIMVHVKKGGPHCEELKGLHR